MTKRGVEPHDIYRIKLVNDPQVSSDGKRVVFSVTELDEQENCYRAAIWLLDLPNGEPRRLTSGKHRDDQPRWSPDGSTLSFTSDRNPDEVGKGQIWQMPVDGGEPSRLTRLAESVEEYGWSPDGQRIVCVSKVRHGEHDPDSDVRHIRTVRFRYDGEGFLEDKYRQLFVVDVATGNASQITDGPYDHSNPAWSPTGHEIAFVGNRNEGWEFSSVRDIYAIRPAGTVQNIRRVTDGSGKWSQPSWSPDGATIAFLGTQRLDSDSPRAELYVVPAGGGAPESLTTEYDRNVRDGAIADTASFASRAPLWDAEGHSISVVFSEQGQVHIARVAYPDGELSQVTSGRRRHGAGALLPDGGYVFAANDAVTVGELFFCNADGGNMRQLTHLNAEWQDEVTITQPEQFWVESADGRKVHGWIMKPVGFVEGATYPLLLEIHGGPFGMYAESMMHEFQVLAARGYVVLFTNPRGSTGYGDDFAGQLFRAWGKHDFPDLMAAVDWAIEQGYVDAERMGVLGGSYGGYMTNWVITHTDRFKAAMTQRTVSNMYSTFGTDDIFFASAEQTIGALPWEDPEIYWELSPMTYVTNIDTPLLIEMQEEDWRCPPEQSEQLFTALKRLGKTVEMVRYPEESHGMSRTGKPKHRIERFKFMTEWFDRYL